VYAGALHVYGPVETKKAAPEEAAFWFSFD
jgi:hypothetical protein